MIFPLLIKIKFSLLEFGYRILYFSPPPCFLSVLLKISKDY